MRLSELWGRIVALAAVLVAVSCAAQNGGTGDETHFQYCKTQSECDSVAPGTRCDLGRCVTPEVTPVDVQSACAPGCREVRGSPQDAARGCFDRDTRLLVGCSCTPPPSLDGERCHKRVSDGSLWIFDGTLTNDGDFTACEIQDLPTGAWSCDFAACEEPPQSTCTVAETCQTLRCDGQEFDARGCRRNTCTSESGCPSDERCVFLECVETAACSSTSGGSGCTCSSPAFCQPGRVCNSVAAYGPRGEWSALTVATELPGCSEPPCRHDWTVVRDGPIHGSGPRIPGSLPIPKDTLLKLVDGVEMRRALRDGITCNPRTSAATYTLELQTSEGTLTRDMTGCLEGPEYNIFRMTWEAFGAISPW